MQGKESREEDAAPLSSGFVTESHGRNRAQNGAVPSGPPLDSVPSIPAKEPNSRADWRIPLEQVSMQEPNFVAFQCRFKYRFEVAWIDSHLNFNNF